LEGFLKGQLGDEYGEFAKACDTPCRKSFRLNTIKAAGMAFDFARDPVPWCPEGFYTDRQVGKTAEHFQGLVYVQESASMIPAMALAPAPGELVLDLSAAPGSKTTQMAALMENSGCIVANEIDRKRLNALRFNLNRMGVANTLVTHMDGTRFAPAMKFDRVLLDAPCSDLGQLRDNPKALTTWGMGKVRRLSSLQKRLMDTAAALVREGGVIVYSTCTFWPQENEEVVDHAVARHGLALQRVDLGFKCHRGLGEYDGDRYHPDVEKASRIYPHDNDTGGFFVARLVK